MTEGGAAADEALASGAGNQAALRTGAVSIAVDSAVEAIPIGAVADVLIKRFKRSKRVGSEAAQAAAKNVDELSEAATKAVDDGVSIKGAGGAKNITKNDLLDESLSTKPQNSPNPQKWLDKGGKIHIDEDGLWSYTNSSGQSVKYNDGYPNFKDAGLTKQEVDIGEFSNYAADFKKADSLAPNGPRDAVNNTWHHNQDGHTLQEVDKAIHKEFTHRGGMSLKNK